MRLVKDKRGATAVEYGVIAALIAAPVVGALNHEFYPQWTSSGYNTTPPGLIANNFRVSALANDPDFEPLIAACKGAGGYPMIAMSNGHPYGVGCAS